MLKTKNEFQHVDNVHRPVVFFLLDERNDTVKIGMSRSLDQRVKSIKSNSPYMRVIGIVACTDETVFYQKSKAVRWMDYLKLKGDIFIYHNDLICYIKKWGYYFG